jgi:hypothetical protein
MGWLAAHWHIWWFRFIFWCIVGGCAWYDFQLIHRIFLRWRERRRTAWLDDWWIDHERLKRDDERLLRDLKQLDD